MKNSICLSWLAALSAMLLSPTPTHAAGLETGFSYQGRLFDNGVEANGLYEIEFVLRDAATGGNQVGTTVSQAPVLVTNGLFQVTVDFGTNVWDGTKLWLDVGVRTNGATAAHVLLTPSQLIQPVPYAIHAIKAGELVGALPGGQLSGTYSNAISLNNAANAFSGSGAGLTSLNASQLTSGTVADDRIAATIARDSELLSISNALSGQLTSGSSSSSAALNTASNELSSRLVATNTALVLLLDGTNSALMGKISTASNVLQTAIDNEAAARGAGAAQLSSGDNTFAGSNHFSGVTVLTNANNVMAGDGSGLTALNASQLTSGTVADARIDSALARDSELLSVSNSLSSQLTSNGSSLQSTITTTSNDLSARLLATNSALVISLNATNTALMGKISTASNALQTAIDNEAAARASAGTQLATGDNSFAGSNHFSGVTVLTNANNVMAGDGSALTALNASHLTAGTVADARIDSALARDSELLSASNSLNSQISANLSTLTGSLTTTSNGLDARLVATNSAWVARIDATNTALMGKVTTTSNTLQTAVDNEAAARSAAITQLGTGDNVFAGSNHFSGITVLTNANNVMAGDGSALTALNASQLTSGTVADARVASTLARDSELLSVSNALSSQLTSLDGAITTTSNGLSSRLVATNAALVALLDATNTALMSKIGTTSNALDTAIANEASARAAAVSQLGTRVN